MENRRRSLHLALSVAIPVLIAACAGGGNDSGNEGSIELAPPASTPARSTDTHQSGLYKSSYMNLKGIWTDSLPPELAVSEYANTFGRFDNTSDKLGLFSAKKTYTTSPESNTQATAAEAQPAQFDFSVWNENTQQYDKNPNAWVQPTTASACSDVRKFLVADFNNDGLSDIFVTCMGWTHTPYPGDANRLVLSRTDGRYDIHRVDALSRAFTSATASDVDGDGDTDVIVLTNTSTNPLQVLLNNGQGQFTLETGVRMPAIGHGYYALEMADANGDGILDLIVGGHEGSENRPTRIYINPGDNRFFGVTPVTVPKSDTAAGADVLDFAVTGSGTHATLWVLRTSHDGHQGRVIQKARWSDLQTGSASYEAVFTASQGNAHWIAPARVNGSTTLVSDDPSMTQSMLDTPTLQNLP